MSLLEREGIKKQSKTTKESRKAAETRFLFLLKGMDKKKEREEKGMFSEIHPRTVPQGKKEQVTGQKKERKKKDSHGIMTRQNKTNEQGRERNARVSQKGLPGTFGGFSKSNRRRKRR